MLKGQKLNTDEGIEVLLFPLEYMNISQDEGGSASHQGSLNIDFLGWGAQGRILRCPYYAPCDMTCVYHNENAWYNVWDSDKPVYCADGVTRNISLMVIHDNTLPPLGSKVKQGDLLGHTGTAGNVTGDHVHMNVGVGPYHGQEQTPQGVWQLKDSLHIYNAMFVNNTVIINGRNHPWKTYDGGVIPPTPTPTLKRKKFPWVLYAKKLREKS